MSRPGSSNRRADGRNGRLATMMALATAMALGSTLGRAKGQTAPPVPPAALPPTVVATPALQPVPSEPGSAVVGGPVIENPPAVPVLPTEVQVVRFQGSEGLKIEVLGPNPEPCPQGDGKGAATFGFKVGVPYRLRVTNLPSRPEAELFPVIEIVGHLHRPKGIDPGKYPVRVVFDENDFVDAVDRGRLVTQIIYLEDPLHALPIAIPKDTIPVVTVSPAEEPLKVAAALGRVMAVVRMGGRKPSTEEIAQEAQQGALTGTPCPFAGNDGGPCKVECGPVCGTPPPSGRPWIPCDEFLCDGGDRAEPLHFGGEGGLRGIDPRDAVITFDDGRRPRILPTNVVCVFAPRFAEVRASVGPNEAYYVQGAKGEKYLAKQATESAKQGPKRMVQNQGAEDARQRMRASGLASRVRAGGHVSLQILDGYDLSTHIAGRVQVQAIDKARLIQKPLDLKERRKLDGIKTAEGLVVTGILAGAGQQVMSWKPSETVGVETPPSQPGLAVIKRVSAEEAEPGDELKYLIQYRNMGNTPIHAVSIVDSLLPRLDYIPGSAEGPKGTIFTTTDNEAGSTELRWELPEAIKPGASGYVTFKVKVR